MIVRSIIRFPRKQISVHTLFAQATLAGKRKYTGEISGSQGGEYEYDHPDDKGSRHLWNVGKLVPDYTA
jgi:hypothetical protein